VKITRYLIANARGEVKIVSRPPNRVALTEVVFKVNIEMSEPKRPLIAATVDLTIPDWPQPSAMVQMCEAMAEEREAAEA
jgi:hypothetical protein